MASDYDPYPEATRKWRKEPMKYITHWWEPKFAWWPTRVFDPPPNSEDIFWVSKSYNEQDRVWLGFYLRRKYVTNGLEEGWMKIRYEGSNGLGSIIRGQLNRLCDSWAKYQAG